MMTIFVCQGTRQIHLWSADNNHTAASVEAKSSGGGGG